MYENITKLSFRYFGTRYKIAKSMYHLNMQKKNKSCNPLNVSEIKAVMIQSRKDTSCRSDRNCCASYRIP